MAFGELVKPVVQLVVLLDEEGRAVGRDQAVFELLIQDHVRTQVEHGALIGGAHGGFDAGRTKVAQRILEKIEAARVKRRPGDAAGRSG